MGRKGKERKTVERKKRRHEERVEGRKKGGRAQVGSVSFLCAKCFVSSLPSQHCVWNFILIATCPDRRYWLIMVSQTAIWKDLPTCHQGKNQLPNLLSSASLWSSSCILLLRWLSHTCQWGEHQQYTKSVKHGDSCAVGRSISYRW